MRLISSSKAELLSTGGGSPIVVATVTDRPLHVGRDATCDLVLTDPSVSRNHAVLWIEGGQLWVTDLGSRNGSYLGEKRLVVASAVPDGGQVRFGNPGRTLTARLTTSLVNADADQRLAVQDVTTRLLYPLGRGPLRIGTGPQCPVRLAEGPEVAAVVVLQDDGRQVWVGLDDEMVEIRVGQDFDIRGRQLRVVELSERNSTTVGIAEDSRYPYVAEFDPSPRDGPHVRVTDLHAGRRVQVSASLPAVLLFVLAKAWLHDTKDDPAERGWLSDDDVITGLWGRGPTGQLKVVVCRARAELREGGLDPWFVEKRRGALRLRVEDVRIARLGAG